MHSEQVCWWNQAVWAQLIWQKEGMLSRGPWACLINGPCELNWDSTRPSASCCSWRQSKVCVLSRKTGHWEQSFWGLQYNTIKSNDELLFHKFIPSVAACLISFIKLTHLTVSCEMTIQFSCTVLSKFSLFRHNTILHVRWSVFPYQVSKIIFCLY